MSFKLEIESYYNYKLNANQSVPFPRLNLSHLNDKREIKMSKNILQNEEIVFILNASAAQKKLREASYQRSTQLE